MTDEYEWMYRVDEFDFLTGKVNTIAVLGGMHHGMDSIGEPPPDDELAWRERWWWNRSTLAWEKRIDMRGHYWYDPADTNQRWTATHPDDQPPAGWKFLMPGSIPPPSTDAQLLREAQADAVRQVNAERDRQLQQPIDYDNARFDADQRAQDNIKAKAEELRALDQLGQEPPTTMLFWIDYTNNLHFFDTAGQYKLWLAGLIVAISTRGSLAYLAANQKKAAIAAARTVADVWAGLA